MSVRRDEPFEVQPRANAAMARVLRVATIAAALLGVAGVLVPSPAGRAVAWGAVAVVVVTPLARVAWLALRWTARRDVVFALLAAGLLALVAVGGVLAALQG